MSKIEDAAEALARPLAEKTGLDIYDVEYKKEGPGFFLRVYICGDRPVTLDDCEKISRPLSAALDEADITNDPYFLEVSSPGIERTLKRDKHILGALGETVEIKLFAPIDGTKRLTGTLKNYSDGILTLYDNEADKEYNIEKNKASSIKTLYIFEQE